MDHPRLILASSSPRRRELLAEAGYDFAVVEPHEDVECGLSSDEGPAGVVRALAYRKAEAVRRQLRSHGDRETGRQGDWETGSMAAVVAADTVVECDGAILGKPRDESDAREMLRQLNGREHRVLTGLCVWPVRVSSTSGEHWEQDDPLVRVAVTKLRMDPLSDAQIDAYLSSGEWAGKAGAFGYQDRLGWVHVVAGSESNVVGLPMELLAEMLVELGVR